MSSHEGVLTSLLNEMDGVQELVGVTIIAATNRPDVMVRLPKRCDFTIVSQGCISLSRILR